MYDSFVETVDDCPAEPNIAVPANVTEYNVSVTANNLAGSSAPAQQSEWGITLGCVYVLCCLRIYPMSRMCYAQFRKSYNLQQSIDCIITYKMCIVLTFECTKLLCICCKYSKIEVSIFPSITSVDEFFDIKNYKCMSSWIILTKLETFLVEIAIIQSIPQVVEMWTCRTRR